MRLTQQRDIRNMLGAAWEAAAVDGSGRSDLAAWLSSLKRGLPTTVQRRLPSDGPSALVYLAYAWTALYTAITAIDPIINPADRRYLPLALVYIAVMVFIGFHLSHGAWSMFQSVGFSHPRYTPVIRRLAAVVAWVLIAGFISVPVAVLAGLVR